MKVKIFRAIDDKEVMRFLEGDATNIESLIKRGECYRSDNGYVQELSIVPEQGDQISLQFDHEDIPHLYTVLTRVFGKPASGVVVQSSFEDMILLVWRDQ